jgi:hypothetical protein
VGSCLSRSGQFTEALPWFERAIAEAEKGDVHGCIDHRSLGASLHWAGYCLSRSGQFAEALPWLERAIAEAEKGDVRGRIDHQSLGASLHQMGWCLSRSGRFAEARPWLERAIAAKEKGDSHGRIDHDSLGFSLHEMGSCLSDSGQFAEARPWFERAVAEAEQGDVHGRVDHQILEAMKAAIHDIEVAPSVAPLDDTSRQELAARTAKGLEILGLKAVADPETVADSVLRWIYYSKEPQKSAAADDQIAVAVAYGDAVARVTGWQWNLYLWQGHQDFALISPDARYVHLPISFISRQPAAASEATALLLFNMLAAGDFSQARPGDLAVLG